MDVGLHASFKDGYKVGAQLSKAIQNRCHSSDLANAA